MVDIDAKDNDTWVNVCHILKTKGPQKPCSWNGLKKIEKKRKISLNKEKCKGREWSPQQ